jgi:PAS domain S-box-containing protein
MDRELLQAIVDQTADAVVFADVQGVIRIWNPAAERLFGFSAVEAVGASLDLIIPERLRPQHWAGFDRAIASGTTRLEGKPTVTRGLHKSGQRLYVEMTFAVVRSPSGTVAGSISIARDVTARYEAERARRSTGDAG